MYIKKTETRMFIAAVFEITEDKNHVLAVFVTIAFSFQKHFLDLSPR